MSADRLHELDWHESTQVAGLTLTATPARHFCGRGLRNTQHTLWASWVVSSGEHRVYHSGDTGYFEGFKDIGASFGPFDATMIQLGAYSEFWPEIHMTPEEAVRSHLDLQGGDAAEGVLLPIHWGTFNLAQHPWAEPADRTMLLAHKAGVAMATPRPGEPFEPGAAPAVDPWWRGWRRRRPGVGRVADGDGGACTCGGGARTCGRGLSHGRGSASPCGGAAAGSWWLGAVPRGPGWVRPSHLRARGVG